ncbi:MAG: 4Fe-4S binding protein [Candidatus Nezhaarchaeales archaeon]
MAKADPSWRELPIAGVILEPGNISESRTGEWRTGLRPIKDQSKCKKCYLCWAFCPDVSIAIEDDDTVIDYYHCKGCGLCSRVCPYGAIAMVEERE